jgi:glycosyltransferase involved in cell wall biosynthesis
MEEALQQKIYWVDDDKPLSWINLGLDVPEVFIQSGWSFRAFVSLGREVKQAGGSVIGLSDANWRGDFRQLVLGSVVFRVLYRPHFDAMLVAGREGQRLMRYFGVPADRIRVGMYGADSGIFPPGPPLAERAKRFLFVGRFDPVKNVVALTRAFERFARMRPEWTLQMCGSGKLRNSLMSHERIFVEDFVQPGHLATRYHGARFLVLPSILEPWGVVVHEAALCGCALLLSNAVGSAKDLATTRNALMFNPSSEHDLVRALHAAADLDAQQLTAAEIESRTLANKFGPQRFADEVGYLIHEFIGHKPGRNQP